MTTPLKSVSAPTAAYNLYSCVDPSEKAATLSAFQIDIERECAKRGADVEMAYLYDLCSSGQFHVLRIGHDSHVIGLVLLYPTFSLLTGKKALHVLFAYARPGYNVGDYIAMEVPEYARWAGYSRVTATLVRRGWFKFMRKYGWAEEPPTVFTGT